MSVLGLLKSRSGLGNFKMSTSSIRTSDQRMGPFLFFGRSEQSYGFYYLVLGGSQQSGIYFDATVSLIPMAKVKDLSAQYGNFMRCGGIGQAEGQRSVLNWVVIAADGKIRDAISELMNKIKTCATSATACYPVIKMDAAELRILKFVTLKNGVETPVQGNMGSTTNSLITHMEIMNDCHCVN